MAEKVGEIYYEVGADISPLLSGSKQAESVLSDMAGNAKTTGKAIDSLGREAKSTASNLDQITSHAKSMDSSMQTLNTSVSAVAAAIAQSTTNTTAASMTLTQMNAAMQTLIASVNSMATAMQSAGNSTRGATNEFSRAEAIIEGLGNQIAILDEAQENGARSAAVLAAQLRAGSGATDEEKKKIGELTGQLFDMKSGVDQGTKSHGAWRQQMQQAGYQVQDFIVQVQGGQSALVAFSQQGSQLAGAFGPGGAVIGAVIALGTVLVGTLVKSLGSAEDQLKTMAAATNALNEVINISQNGVAALSDKYALLARTNAEAATILRNQAIIEYNQAISKLPDAIGKASDSIIGFGDSLLSGLRGGSASISSLGSALDALSITTNDYSEAVKQAQGAGSAFSATTNSLIQTVSVISKQFGISSQQAFELAKQLDDVSKNKSPEALQQLVIELQNMKSSTDDGKSSLITFVAKLADLVRESANAKANMAALKGEMDNLTQGQKNLIQQSERDLALSRLQGAARARLQALYKAQDAGFSADSPQALQMQKEAEQTYNNVKAQQELNKSSSQLGKQQDSVIQKLDALRQKSEVTATSTSELSREMAILTAQQSLGKAATTDQIRLAGEYAAKTWDNANALKAQAAAQKLKAETEQAGRFSDQQKAAADVAVNPYTGEATNPAAQVELEQKQKLAAVAKYEAMGAMTEQQAQDTRTAIVKQGAYARMQIVKDEAQKQIDSMSMMLGGFQSGFEGLANIVARGAGESSSAYKALFAVSKGFAIAQAGLNLQLAISNAMASGPFPWNLANMAQVAAAGGQVISAIGGASYGGAREHGGPVNANSMYRVGEGGKPEIFKASNGSQYMIPGDNGSVISNKDIGGSGGGGGVIEQHNYFTIHSATGDPEELTKQIAQISYQQSLRAMKDQQRPGGMLTQRK